MKLLSSGDHELIGPAHFQSKLRAKGLMRRGSWGGKG